MSKNARAILIIVVLIAVIAVAVVLARRSNAPTGATNGEVTEPTSLPPQPVGETPPPATEADYIIIMKDDVYAPSSLTVKQGDTVTWRNDGTLPQWPASAVHPTHLIYPEFDPKQAIAPGASWTFTFDKAGTWRWHDHIHANVNGTITVTE